MIYDTIETPFTEEDYNNGFFIKDKEEIDIEEYIDNYIVKLTQDTLDTFTTIQYTMQPSDAFN